MRGEKRAFYGLSSMKFKMREKGPSDGDDGWLTKARLNHKHVARFMTLADSEYVAN